MKPKWKSSSEGGIRICLLASGSSGNAIFISDGTTCILIDAGLSGVEIERRLTARGFSPRDLSAILVTHEHRDHIMGVGVLSRRFRVPVYISPQTYRVAEKQLGKLHSLTPFECGTGFSIDRFRLHPFSTSHDAEDPVGFTISRDRIKIGIATDLGIVTAMVREHLRNCTLLILEANHDPEMLINGPYPWPLKQRIRGRSGHLSNEDCCTLLQSLYHPRLRQVVLAHLSETNNTPQKAHRAFQSLIKDHEVTLKVASQDGGTDVICLLPDGTLV